MLLNQAHTRVVDVSIREGGYGQALVEVGVVIGHRHVEEGHVGVEGGQPVVGWLYGLARLAPRGKKSHHHDRVAVLLQHLLVLLQGVHRSQVPWPVRHAFPWLNESPHPSLEVGRAVAARRRGSAWRLRHYTHAQSVLPPPTGRGGTRGRRREGVAPEAAATHSARIARRDGGGRRRGSIGRRRDRRRHCGGGGAIPRSGACGSVMAPGRRWWGLSRWPLLVG